MPVSKHLLVTTEHVSIQHVPMHVTTEHVPVHVTGKDAELLRRRQRRGAAAVHVSKLAVRDGEGRWRGEGSTVVQGSGEGSFGATGGH
mmetsp:Transcript_27410/g.56120  ORF Transcript_27410/g.56120 Transcript_27410/m.56120 type:complete len:88 (+) Transcript_27410:419-682(+)